MKLQNVINNHNVQVIRPSTCNIYRYSKYRSQIEELEAKLVASGIKAIEICLDDFPEVKDKFDLVFTATTNPDRIGEFSVLVKPRRQKEGHDITIIEDKYDL